MHLTQHPLFERLTEEELVSDNLYIDHITYLFINYTYLLNLSSNRKKTLLYQSCMNRVKKAKKSLVIMEINI